MIYDPNSVAILRFKNGALGKVATSIECRQPYLFPVLMQGDKERFGTTRISTEAWPGLAKGQWAKIPTAVPDSGAVDDHPYQGQFAEFVECLRKNKRPHNDLKACSHVHEVIYAIQESIKSGKTIKVKRTPGT